MNDENVKAGMEIKTEGENVAFENGYVNGTAPEVPQAIYLSRTPQGIMRDDEHGKEIASIFDIIQPGDNINHQDVVEVNSDSVVLDYFGKKSTLTNENEIFSIVISDELDQWKKELKSLDFTKAFEHIDTPHLFRALEMTCMKINMEEVTGLYPVIDNKLDQRCLAIIASTLRKNIVDDKEDLTGEKIITFSINYNPEANAAEEEYIDSKKGTCLYNISLFNPDNKPVREGDYIIIC